MLFDFNSKYSKFALSEISCNILCGWPWLSDLPLAAPFLSSRNGVMWRSVVGKMDAAQIGS
jgi:hypothetical protein